MRLFQSSAIYPNYRPRLAKLTKDAGSFEDAIAVFLNDRFGATSFLLPVLDGSPDAFFANGDDEHSQRLWARAQGMRVDADLQDILLAQVEHHRTEIFYTLAPIRDDDAFVKRLPGSVKRTAAWRAAPSPHLNFGSYGVVLNNFPSILEGYKAAGMRAEYFSPAHDPEMDAYARRVDRPVDIVFVGAFTRHHQKRARYLELIAALSSRYRIALHLDRSKWSGLANSPLGLIGPLNSLRMPSDIRKAAYKPVFGRDAYEAISQGKVVINMAIDMAGNDRGNMRCWEALGLGAAMVSDDGVYPQGIVNGETATMYHGYSDIVTVIDGLLQDEPRRAAIAKAGNDMIRSIYSKDRQWADFQRLVA